MRRAIVLALALLLPLPAVAEPDDAPASVLVETVTPQRGALPDIVVAYGSAAPATDGGTTLGLEVEGRVSRLLVTPGEAVREGDRLLEFMPSAQAVSTYKQAVTALDLARQQQAHTASLLRQQLATRDQQAQADKAVADAEAALEALRRGGGGKLVEILTAPFDGIVTAIPVAQGDRTVAGAPLMNLTRADGLVVTVGIEPADRARLHRGDAARLEPLSGAGEAVDGKLLRVDAMLNAKTRLVDADISAPPGLIAGETFRAAIAVGSIEGWLVPRAAVLTDDDGAHLFQIADGKAVRVALTVLGADDGNDVVSGPVDPHRPIVTDGSYQLSDGMVVRQGTAP